jgi:hypothetical protein
MSSRNSSTVPPPPAGAACAWASCKRTVASDGTVKVPKMIALSDVEKAIAALAAKPTKR